MREEVAPTISQDRIGKCDSHEVYHHDAYGTITMTVVHGGDKTMFGSDIKHDHRVRITIQRAKLARNLSNDWIHGDCRSLVEFEMSHAQFAQFITSVGNGSGTPVTLLQAPPRDVVSKMMPAIKTVETKADTFKREIKDSAQRRLLDIKGRIDELGALLDGTVSKKQLREIHHNLKCSVENLPSNMAFVVEQAEEAFEKAQASAKIQIEAYVDQTAKRLGLKQISQLAQLESKEYKDE